MPNTSSQNAAVLITAAASGIGAACARALAQKGFLVFAGVHHWSKAAAMQDQVPGRLIPVRLDVTDLELIQVVAEQIAENLKTEKRELRGIVNCATHEHPGPLEILPFSIIRGEIEVDYLGSLAVIRAFLPLLRQSRGRIINFSSMNGRCVFRGVGANSAAKYAVEAMSDALRLELAPAGINVSLIEPGAVNTPLWDKCQQRLEALPTLVPPEQLQLYYPQWSEAVTRAKADEVRFQRIALPVERIVETVEHALTSAKPKTRYVVGKDAQVILFLKWLLPDRWFDRVANRMFNDQ